MRSNTIEIMGGLGNQLFQIFTLLAYSLRNKTPFYFSAQAIANGARKKTYWDTLFLQNLAPLVKPTPNSNTPHSQHIYRETDFHYQPIPNTEQSLKLFGYFQSYKYFADHQENIYRLIRLRETQAKYKTSNSTIAYDKTIAMHFRVGDYAQLPNHHPLMTLEYYTQALTQFLKDVQTANARASALCETLEQIGERTAGERTWQILYFCEEPDQAYVETKLIMHIKANPLFKDKFTFQCIDHQLEDWEQVIVMSLCKHHIIANSTFSWWGAYLGLGMRSEGGTHFATHTTTPDITESEGISPNIGGASLVYYPRTWFGSAMGQKNMNDLFPPHWRRINV
jgi:pterin-4a-carbinolamine dehydratase